MTMSSDNPENDDDRLPTGSDHVLLKRFRNGEQDAATALYLRYSQRLQGLAKAETSSVLVSRFDPDDVVQSVFRTFFRRVSRGLYDVPADDELWQLLLVIALNKIRDLAVHHRAKKRDVTKTDGDSGILQAEVEQDRADRESLDVLKVVMDDFLEHLPTTHALVARLAMEGYQVDEIATETRRSKRTVERILNERRQKLTTKTGLI
jgi:RNA polymerase sigma-70 factor (ECF subfamily)